MTDNFEVWQWALALLAALLAGVAKTGFNGAGTLTAALFAMILPAKAASGVVLPLLIAADLVAVVIYRRHFVWRYFWRLLPWALVGIVAGYFAMGKISDAQAKTVTGAIVVLLTVLHVWRRRRAEKKAASDDAGNGDAGNAAGGGAVAGSAPVAEVSRVFGAATGVMAGFTTLVANAAGPLVTIYFLAMRLPKMEFVGTGAIFFMVVNWVKVPFMADLGLINTGSLRFNALLLPAVLLGTLVGRILIARVNQKTFETLALALGAIAGLKLLLG
ncbi:MAG: sulfite exporter TauE/SafE family protein [Puniceicoccales bacterium]|nr:sulfite exporter TauE/SafE family protein [Puniceicoccales bacterium]